MIGHRPLASTLSNQLLSSGCGRLCLQLVCALSWLRPSELLPALVTVPPSNSPLIPHWLLIPVALLILPYLSTLMMCMLEIKSKFHGTQRSSKTCTRPLFSLMSYHLSSPLCILYPNGARMTPCLLQIYTFSLLWLCLCCWSSAWNCLPFIPM